MIATSTVHKPFNLTRRFLLLGLLSIGLVGILSSILLTRFLTQRMLQQDAEVTMGFVQSIVNVELTTGSFFGESADNNLKEFARHIATMPDMVRANVYAVDKTILWSSDAKLVGRRFTDNPDLEQALAGKLEIESGIVSDEKRMKQEHTSLDRPEIRFVEIYIPIKEPNGDTIIGVVEIYRIPNALFAAINTGHRLIWTIAVLGGLFLYATLFWTVRRADQLIRNQQERLVESETMAALGEMASAVAHGIRNPLASIRSSAELWHDVRDANGRESAQDIISEVDRLEKWVRDLLTYSQPQDNKLEAVELVPLIRESLGNFARETEKRAVTVQLLMNEQLPPVRGDSALLGQAFNNLIANALEAMQDGGSITVEGRIAENRRHIELSISDTGSGIAPEQLGKVCTPFFTTKPKGLGVGLALVRRIVRRFGGSMGIESRKGLGTTVTLNLLVVR